jgi:hypothetical protein
LNTISLKFLAGGLEGVQRGEAGDLRALRVGGASADHHLADAGTIDDAPFERRRAPLLRVVLLDVIHEVQRQRRRRARVERGEHARLPRCWNQLDACEARVARELRHVFGALRKIEVFGGDRRQRNPLAQFLNRRVVLRDNLRNYGVTVRLSRLREQCLRAAERRRARCSGHAGVEEVPPGDACSHGGNYNPTRLNQCIVKPTPIVT